MHERKTHRLLLRQWEARDFEPYANYYADEKTAKYVGGVFYTLLESGECDHFGGGATLHLRGLMTDYILEHLADEERDVS